MLMLATGTAGGAEDGPTIRLTDGRFEVVGLSTADLQRLAKADLGPECFAVHVLTDGEAASAAMIGSYRVAGEVLRFEPRFPLVPGLRYRAVFRPEGRPEVRADFSLPRPKPAPATVIEQVYPTRNRLPENQLKFYIHFSAPMSRGQAYRHIRLLDDRGQPVEDPFLELDEELWDPDGRRFTLFFDPGRIKRGLKPREEVGPSLIEGKRYTLVIDRGWEDARGNPLKATVRKSFSVGVPDDTPIDPKAWKLQVPPEGQRTALTVQFPESLDQALLERLLWVTDAEGNRVAGSVRVTDEETRWHFTPQNPWRAGKYRLVVDTTLEDLAGNSVGRPFEVDLFEKVDREVKTATVELPFEVPTR